LVTLWQQIDGLTTLIPKFFSLYYVKFTNANETLIQPISFTAAQKKQKTKQNNNTKSIEISCFCEFLCFNQFFFLPWRPVFKKKIILFFWSYCLYVTHSLWFLLFYHHHRVLFAIFLLLQLFCLSLFGPIS